MGVKISPSSLWAPLFFPLLLFFKFSPLYVQIGRQQPVTPSISLLLSFYTEPKPPSTKSALDPHQTLTDPCAHLQTYRRCLMLYMRTHQLQHMLCCWAHPGAHDVTHTVSTAQTPTQIIMRLPTYSYYIFRQKCSYRAEPNECMCEWL